MQDAPSPHARSPLGDVVVTADGSLTIKDASHGECYHSVMGASREARELYVEASGLRSLWNHADSSQARHEAIVSVLDVGLGLGYNAITTIDAWLKASAPTSLVIQSLEIDPRLVTALASGEAPWQDNWQADLRLLSKTLAVTSESPSMCTWSMSMGHPIHDCRLEWYVQVCDARFSHVTPVLANGWDYIWQDPFSPEKNPGMWTRDWFTKIYSGSHRDTTLMTYSVARGVRDALSEAGWMWEKFPSQSGIKRHWLRAKPMPSSQSHTGTT